MITDHPTPKYRKFGITTSQLAAIEINIASYLQHSALISEVTINGKEGLKKGPAHALACAITPQILKEVQIIDE